MAKKALLIGVSQYGEGLPTLLAAPMDVQAMSRVLKDPELEPFEQVRTLIDPDLGQMQTAIAELFKSCQKGDLGLLYFSGHGITDDNSKLYLCTRNTSKDNFKGNSLSASVIQDVMSDYRYQRNQVVILDCCYSGAFAEGWRTKSVDVNIHPQLEVEGSVLLTSSTSTQKSFEQEGAELSLYTSYIVQGIESGAAEQDGDGYISADELHEYAKRHVKTAKPNMEPEIYGIKQGIKIKLIKARVDRKLHYRRLVEKYVQNGRISIVGEDILELKREEWGLSDQIAIAIMNEVLEPDRRRLKNLERYQKTLEKAVQLQFPLTVKYRVNLKDLQEVLGLRDEDIQDRVTAVCAAREAELKKQQEESAKRSQESRQNSPISSHSQASSVPLLTFPSSIRLSRRGLITIAGLGFVGVSGVVLLKIISVFLKMIIEKPSHSLTVDFGNGENLELLYIPKGKFTMGSAPEEEGSEDERPQIKDVNISTFYLGKYEVTQAQWQAIMGNNPSEFTDSEQNPVERVSWNDAQEFCKKLSQKTGQQFRLPSESEWEYAYRAGTTTAYSFGNDESQLGEYAWYSANSGKKTHPVGQKKPNAWGLYDMNGNVWEWCQDSYEKYNSESSRIRKTGKAVERENNSTRILRGGSWDADPRFCRSAVRLSDDPRGRYYALGFRVACSASGLL